jgi:hypothetical protein
MRRTKRAVARQLLGLVKNAYADIDRAQPHGDDWSKVSEAIGRYDGLKQAYMLLTGREDWDVSYEVTNWYIHTPQYQELKARRRNT